MGDNQFDPALLSKQVKKGARLLIQRSGGRIHEATVRAVDSKSGIVTFCFRETVTKEVLLKNVLDINPQLRDIEAAAAIVPAHGGGDDRPSSSVPPAVEPMIGGSEKNVENKADMHDIGVQAAENFEDSQMLRDIGVQTPIEEGTPAENCKSTGEKADIVLHEDVIEQATAGGMTENVDKSSEENHVMRDIGGVQMPIGGAPAENSGEKADVVLHDEQATAGVVAEKIDENVVMQDEDDDEAKTPPNPPPRKRNRLSNYYRMARLGGGGGGLKKGMPSRNGSTQQHCNGKKATDAPACVPADGQGSA